MHVIACVLAMSIPILSASLSGIILTIIVFAGMKHVNIICDSCRQNGIFGMRWKCVKCYDFDLCTPCYNDGKHTLEHEFCRIDVVQGPR